MTTLQILFIAFGVRLARVLADLPIHCLHEEILGEWILEIGSSSSERQLCGHPSPDTNFANLFQHMELHPERRLVVRLSGPNVAVDQDGNTGTFTMVYDEGFEIRIAGDTFFSKFRYRIREGIDPDEALANESHLNLYASICSETGVGWYRNGISGAFGCFTASKRGDSQVLLKDGTTQTRRQPYSREGKQTIRSSNFYSEEKHLRRFQFDHEMIARVNSDASSLWKAAVHAPFESMSEAQMNSLLGRKHFMKPAAAQITQTSDEIKANVLSSLPESVDWRHIDSSIVQQGECGSCYVVSTIASLETRFRVANLLDTRLSAQDLLCSQYCEGCKGGYPFLVARALSESGGVEDSCLHYAASDRQCRQELRTASQCSQRHFATMEYQYVGGFFGGCSEEAIMEEVATHGPVVAAIDAPSSLSAYKSGIFSGCSMPVTDGDEEPGMERFEFSNHAIVIVGYGRDESGVKFWRVRNSWSSSWGEGGYMRMLRGVNECGIESQAVALYPLVEDSITAFKRG